MFDESTMNMATYQMITYRKNKPDSLKRPITKSGHFLRRLMANFVSLSLRLKTARDLNTTCEK